MKSIRNIDSGLLLIILIAIVLVGTTAAILIVNRVNTILGVTESQEALPILVTIDTTNNQLVSAQLVLISVVGQSLAMLDIPPYLAATQEDGTPNRIDYLYNDGNIESFIDTISSLVGVNINYYIRIPGDNVEKIVDLVGGTRMFILGNIDIVGTIPFGETVLDGRKILQYINYYHQSEEREEAADALQQFFERFFLTLSEKRAYIRNAQVLRGFTKLLDTNFNTPEISSVLDIIFTIESGRYSAWKTEGNIRNVRIDNQRQALLFPYFGGQWLKDTLVTIQDSLVRYEESVGESIDMVILNGTTISGLARRTQLLFEQYGFNVTYIGDAESNQITNTIVYDHASYEGASQKVAEIIEATRIEEVETYPYAAAVDPLPDITLVLGTDFDGLYVRN